MTFQIGIVASDGVILASDTKAGRWDRAKAGQVAPKVTSHVPKLICVPEAGIAYCCSGSDVAILTGRRIIEIAKREARWSMQQCAERAASEIWAEVGSSKKIPCEESVLVATVGASGHELYRVVTAKGSYCGRILDRDVNGDITNSAVFFSERFFLCEEAPRTIAHLLPLAAHIVLMAGVLNPTGVGGLEIAICRSGECRKLEEYELAPLRDSSKRLDDLILQRFTSS